MSGQTHNLRFSTRYHILLLIFIAVLPVFGLIAYNGMMDRHEAEKQARNQAMDVLRAINYKQEEIFESATQILSALGRLPAMQNHDIAGCGVLLSAMLSQYRQFTQMAAFNADGELFCSAPAADHTFSIADRAHFQRAMAASQVTTSHYIVSRLTGRPTVFIVNPIHNAAGKIITLVNAGIDYSWLEELILQLPMYDASVLTLFDADGILLQQHPLQDGEGSGTPFSNKELVTQATRQRHLEVIQSRADDGIDYIHAFAPLGTRDSNTFVSISIPAHVVLAKANQELVRNLVIAVIVTFCAVLLAFGWSHRQFVNPIRRLAIAATEVRRGKFTPRIDTENGPAELVQLGATFNQMTQALKRRADDQACIEQALSQLIEQHQQTNPNEFLSVLATILAQALKTKYCFIGLIDPLQPTQIEMRVFKGGDGLLPNMRYNIQGAPCEDLLQHEAFALYHSKVQQQFPGHELLSLHGVESFAGVSLIDYEQKCRGVLAVMDDKPIENSELFQSLLQVFGARVVTELEREETDQQRQQMLDEARLSATAFETHEGMFITDAGRNILRVNRAFSEVTGYDQSAIIGAGPYHLFADPDHCNPCDSIWSHAKDNMKWSGEQTLKRKNGEAFPASIIVSAVEREPGVVSHYVAHFQDISDRKQAEERIKHLAYHDDLTDLPNRTLLLDRLDQTIAALKRRAEFGALLFIDLDHFKNINDSLGHVVGDGLLVAIAERLRNSLRQEDTIARLGGDEFVILLPQLGHERQEGMREVHRLAQKLLGLLSDEYQVNGHTLKISVSIGIVMFPEQELNADDLLRHADLAMYSAKGAGRDSIQFFEPEMQARLIERLQIENELRIGYQQNQFLVYQQPQVRIEDNSIIGSEMLLRWHHPQHGIVAPGAFISVLEDSGMIRPVGEWVLEQACAALAASDSPFNDQTNRPLLAVNVSSHQFLDRGFVECVTNLLKKYAIDGNRLELEITERAVVRDVEETIAKMKALKALGVRFSIDDFGTGYSSLAYIKRLPIDTLKIDRSFVQDCLVDENDRAIVRAIVSMANSLELGIVAEGVENAEQLAFLREIGCPAYQGYYFSQPLPEAEFHTLLRRHAQQTRLASTR